MIFMFQGLDDMEVDDDKKDLINREIKSFRDAHKVCYSPANWN